MPGPGRYTWSPGRTVRRGVPCCSTGWSRCGSLNSQRVAERDSAAVQVNLVVDTSISPRSLMHGSDWAANASFSSNRSMSCTLKPAAFQRQLAGRHRAVAHDGRIAADDRHRADAGAGLQTERFSARLAHQQHGEAPSDRAEELPAVTVPVDRIERRTQGRRAFDGGFG